MKTAQWISTASVAMMILIANIAGSQIVEGLTNYQKGLLQSQYTRWIALFAIFYIGLGGNLLLTSVFTFVAILSLDYLLNEESRYYLFRRHERGYLKTIGTSAVKQMFS
jgi:hypothetical protein